MTAIGETLRRERLRLNLDLEQISRELKISPRFLAAIESEQFNKLPGGVFAKSFVRQYARVLGLDEEEMAAEVQRILEPQPEPAPPAPAIPVVAGSYLRLPRMRAWETVGDSGRRWSSPLASLALVVAVIVLCSGVYAWWQARRSPAAPAAPVAASAARTASAAVPQTAAAPPVQTAAAQPDVTAPLSRPSPIQPDPANSADRRAPDFVSPALASAQPAGVSPTALQPSPAAPPGDPSAVVQVQLTADEPVWVRARSGGKYLFSGTLDANQTRTVDASGVVELLLGNAGGIHIVLNGKPIGTVGPKGQVRTIQLTSGGFTIVPPRPSAPFVDPL
jgi:cytoskeleton protein RodZ